MLNRSRQMKIAILQDDRDAVAWLVENAGCAVEFEHIGLARRLNRHEILNILLADVKPQDCCGDAANTYLPGQRQLTSALC